MGVHLGPLACICLVYLVCSCDFQGLWCDGVHGGMGDGRCVWEFHWRSSGCGPVEAAGECYAMWILKILYNTNWRTQCLAGTESYGNFMLLSPANTDTMGLGKPPSFLRISTKMMFIPSFQLAYEVEGIKKPMIFAFEAARLRRKKATRQLSSASVLQDFKGIS